MRTYVALAFSLLAGHVLCAPVVRLSYNATAVSSHQLDSRGQIIPIAVEVGSVMARRIIALLNKLPATPLLRKAWLARYGLPPDTLFRVVRMIQVFDVHGIPDEVIQYAFKATQHDSGLFSKILQEAREASINAVSGGGFWSSNDMKLLGALARDGDDAAFTALRSAKLTPQQIKDYKLGSLLNPPQKMITPEVVTTGVVAAGAGVIAVGILASAHVDASDVDFTNTNAYPSVPGGAIPEDEQRQILATIAQHPDEYPRIMEQIRKVEGIIPAEITLFETADPAKAATIAVVAKRNIEDLD